MHLTAVEVDQGLGSNLCLDVVACASLFHLLGSCVERSHVGVVVLGVVELHDLAADGRLEGTIVVCVAWSVRGFCVDELMKTRRTRQVGKSGLAAGEGGAGEGCALCSRGNAGSESRAHGRVTEDGGGRHVCSVRLC